MEYTKDPSSTLEFRPELVRLKTVLLFPWLFDLLRKPPRNSHGVFSVSQDPFPSLPFPVRSPFPSSTFSGRSLKSPSPAPGKAKLQRAFPGGTGFQPYLSLWNEKSCCSQFQTSAFLAHISLSCFWTKNGRFARPGQRECCFVPLKNKLRWSLVSKTWTKILVPKACGSHTKTEDNHRYRTYSTKPSGHINFILSPLKIYSWSGARILHSFLFSCMQPGRACLWSRGLVLTQSTELQDRAVTVRVTID